MRAVLIVNPNATSTTAAGRDLLAHALESRVRLTVEHTNHRGHAIEIAEQAVLDGVDVVIVHGGDGTVNEVVNGLLGKPGGAAPTNAQHRIPAVGVVPGGSANVFARSLGIPQDPIDATNQLIDLLSEYRRTRTWRRIGLMDCGERWGVFTAGMGVDGEVVASVEAQRDRSAKQKGVSAMRYIRAAVPTVLRSARREPTLTLQLGGREPVPGVHFVFVSNSSPWTYANKRPVWTNPGTGFDTGLGVFATTSMSVWRNVSLVRQMLSKRPKLKAAHLIREDDVDFVRVTSDIPVATQIDGDYIGFRDAMTFRAVADAVAVVAPLRGTDE
ncbi:diacylglycerol/lipid kinase family protein [Mycolicibacterium mengxianglii]|uniref:diacylglycerol/lipid kinase family protein n=1 Tax=Mycolicibacterium mengxianglii TaxID=2736649 RepID=UPI0018D16D93|nr:diacylglycerol kinase family protein [Mycolicibacterium mengxianglii]